MWGKTEHNQTEPFGWGEGGSSNSRVRGIGTKLPTGGRGLVGDRKQSVNVKRFHVPKGLRHTRV